MSSSTFCMFHIITDKETSDVIFNLLHVPHHHRQRNLRCHLQPSACSTSSPTKKPQMSSSTFCMFHIITDKETSDVIFNLLHVPHHHRQRNLRCHLQPSACSTSSPTKKPQMSSSTFCMFHIITDKETSDVIFNLLHVPHYHRQRNLRCHLQPSACSTLSPTKKPQMSSSTFCMFHIITDKETSDVIFNLLHVPHHHRQRNLRCHLQPSACSTSSPTKKPQMSSSTFCMFHIITDKETSDVIFNLLHVPHHHRQRNLRCHLQPSACSTSSPTKKPQMSSSTFCMFHIITDKETSDVIFNLLHVPHYHRQRNLRCHLQPSACSTSSPTKKPQMSSSTFCMFHIITDKETSDVIFNLLHVPHHHRQRNLRCHLQPSACSPLSPTKKPQMSSLTCMFHIITKTRQDQMHRP
ncbi:hypothetical protein ACOMHN_010824 [Nucella lapillus]